MSLQVKYFIKNNCIFVSIPKRLINQFIMAKQAPSKNKKIVAKTPVPVKKNNYPVILIVIICLVTFISYIPSLFNQVDIWDDYYYLSIDSLIKSLSWGNIKDIFSTPYLANYQPLTILSYAFEYHFFKLTPWIYHFDNILIHLLNTALLFWFMQKLTSKPPIAFIAALLFGIHPLHVESVTWVSERKDVLYAFFFILGMLSYLKYKEVKEKKYYIFTLVLFVFSCLSKGMAVTFSAILILIDYLKDKDFKLKKLLDKIPFFIISIIFGIITIKVQKEGGAVAFATNEAYTLADRFFFANYSLFFYLYKMFIPVHLSGLYPYPQNASVPLPVMYYISPFVNALFFAAIIYSIRRSKKMIFGSLFFLISIFPVLQILSIGAAISCDRYFYVSSIGLFYLAGSGFNSLYENKKYRSLIVTIGSVIIIVFGCLTFERAGIWKNCGTFWGNVAEEFPKLELPYFNRAAYYYTNKNYDAALSDFSKALEIYPDYKEALQWRADIYIKKLQYKLAAEDLLRLTKLDPKNFDNYSKLGELYGRYMNDPEKSLSFLLKAFDLKPDNAGTLSDLGVVYGMKGDYKQALLYFKKATDINPNDTNSLKNIAITYKSLGDEKMANEYFSRISQTRKK
jgi:Flp pilus assembly protein TadD